METIGILPCGGLGLRMGSFRYPKELLPIHYSKSPIDGSLRPKLSIEFSIEAFKLAGIKKSYVVVPDWKPEIMRYLGSGSEFGIDIAYLHNSKANGLSHAILSMEPWSDKKITCMALPDTQFFPQNAFVQIIEKLKTEDADLVLGVFPTNEPNSLAPVELKQNGQVIKIDEKPLHSEIMNTWGIAVWNSTFWNFFKSIENTLMAGESISLVFHKAVMAGFKVYGVYFENGSYNDIGRIDCLSFVAATNE